MLPPILFLRKLSYSLNENSDIKWSELEQVLIITITSRAEAEGTEEGEGVREGGRGGVGRGMRIESRTGGIPSSLTA